MSVEIPEYINKSLLEKALKNDSTDSLDIKNFQVTLASGNGENYTSSIYGVFVDYQLNQEEKIISLMVKCLNDSEDFQAVTEEYGLFQKEMAVYTDIGPKIVEMIGEKWLPNCYYTVSGKTNIFVLEDMKFSDYDTVDRLTGLDFAHCKLVVEKLAKVHAASMILYQNNPDKFEEFSYGTIEGKNGSMTLKFFDASIAHLIGAVRKWEGYEKILEKLMNIQKNSSKYLIESMKKVIPKFKSLNHGDLWTNNILFKHDESGAPVDLVFIDFQMSFYSSVGIDWNYFLYTSPCEEVREKYLKDLVEAYHQALKETLGKLKYDFLIPALEDVEEEIRKFEFYGVFCAINMLPLIVMDRSKDIACNYESLSENDPEFRRIQFEGKLYTKLMKKFLLKFDFDGALDIPPCIS